MTESGKQGKEYEEGEHSKEYDEGDKKIVKKEGKKKRKRDKKIVKEEGKKKRKRDKGEEINASASASSGVLDKESNQHRADSSVIKGHKNTKNGNNRGKNKKGKLVENSSQDSKPVKSTKKVKFAETIEVFPSSDVVGAGTGNKKDTLIRGKRFSKEEDEIVKQAVYNYIEQHCLGDKGLDMVLNCKSHRKIIDCWKEIGTCIPNRPYTAVYYRAQVLFRRSESRKWTEEEYELIRHFVKHHGAQWKVLADALGKHRWHVKDTWRRIKPANLKKGGWSQEEYQALFELVNKDLRMKVSEEKKSKHGMLRDNIPWSAISEKLSTRTGATCCMKWYDQLTSPMVSEGKWADADDYRLINLLYQLDASCIEDVDWDNLMDHRSGDVCRKRWSQMVLHVGQHANKSFAEQVEVLAKRYCPDLLDARATWDNKPVVP